MLQFEYQVMQVKPADLEAALNQMSKAGWEVLSVIAAEFAGREAFARQTLDVSKYRVVFKREMRGE